MNIKSERILGTVDELEAMKQVIYKILNTERFKYVIYSWNYGIELSDLFGKDVTYVFPELERRITEALVQDDRIEKCYNFTFDTVEVGVVRVTFDVDTVFGEVNIDKEVMY